MAYLDLSKVVARSASLSVTAALAMLLSACGTPSKGSSSSVASSSSSSSVVVSSSSSSSSSSVSADPCAGSVFCDDFESGSLNGWNVSGQAAVSTEQAYQGSRSVKVTAAGGGYNRNFLSLDLGSFGAAQQSLYGRMMVYLSNQNSLGGDFTFVQADGQPKAVSGAPAGTNVMYRMRLDGRFDHIFANYDTYPNWSTDCWKHPSFNQGTNTPPPADYLIPKNQWACVEWHFDAQADELMFWRDGGELSQIHVSKTGDGCVAQQQQGTWYAPQQFDVLHVGIEQYHNTSKARTMYIDDVQVSDRYIGCP